VCQDCRCIVQELTSIGLETAIQALDYPLPLVNKYRAHYVHCKRMWVRETYMVTREACADCGCYTNPFMVRDLETLNLSVLVDSSYHPEGGWPDGIKGLFNLCWAEYPAGLC
jgi:hypothetical protein